MSTYEQFKSLMRARKYQEAVSMAEQEAHSGASPNPFWLNQQALGLMRQGSYSAAVEICNKALTLQPENSFALLFRSDALLHLNEFSKALTGYEEALRDHKVADRARVGILNCLVQLKEWERALSVLAQGNSADQEMFSFKVKALVGLNRNDEAMKICQEWLKVSPDNKAALWHMVNLEVAVSGLEAVRIKYEKLAKIPSRPPVYGEIYASLCRKAGKMDKAIGQYEKLEAKTTEPSVMRQKAFALAKSGHELEAIPILEELLRVDPNNLYLHSSYQGACRRSSNLERAWRFYHELYTLHPDNKSLIGRTKKIQKELEAASGKDGSV